MVDASSLLVPALGEIYGSGGEFETLVRKVGSIILEGRHPIYLMPGLQYLTQPVFHSALTDVGLPAITPGIFVSDKIGGVRVSQIATDLVRTLAVMCQLPSQGTGESRGYERRYVDVYQQAFELQKRFSDLDVEKNIRMPDPDQIGMDSARLQLIGIERVITDVGWDDFVQLGSSYLSLPELGDREKQKVEKIIKPTSANIAHFITVRESYIVKNHKNAIKHLPDYYRLTQNERSESSAGALLAISLIGILD